MSADTAKEFLEKRKKQIEEDSRYQDKPAQVQINAPLAMIQVAFGAEMSLIKHTLEALDQ